MKDKLKELEELLGTDSYNRVLRIMSFIGAKFPDEIDDLWKEEVDLVFEQDANQKGYLYFSSDCVGIKSPKEISIMSGFVKYGKM